MQRLILISLALAAMAGAQTYDKPPAVVIGAPPISVENVTIIEPTAVASEAVPGTSINIMTLTKRINTTSEAKSTTPSVVGVVPVAFDAETGMIAVDRQALTPSATATSFVTDGGLSSFQSAMDGLEAGVENGKTTNVADIDIRQNQRVDETKDVLVSMPGGIEARFRANNVTDTVKNTKEALPGDGAPVGRVLSGLAQDLVQEGKAGDNSTMTMTMASDRVAVSTQSTNNNARVDVAPGTSRADLEAIAVELSRASALPPTVELIADKVKEAVGASSQTVQTPSGTMNVQPSRQGVTPNTANSGAMAISAGTQPTFSSNSPMASLAGSSMPLNAMSASMVTPATPNPSVISGATSSGQGTGPVGIMTPPSMDAASMPNKMSSANTPGSSASCPGCGVVTPPSNVAQTLNQTSPVKVLPPSTSCPGCGIVTPAANPIPGPNALSTMSPANTSSATSSCPGCGSVTPAINGVTSPNASNSIPSSSPLNVSDSSSTTPMIPSLSPSMAIGVQGPAGSCPGCGPVTPASNALNVMPSSSTMNTTGTPNTTPMTPLITSSSAPMPMANATTSSPASNASMAQSTLSPAANTSTPLSSSPANTSTPLSSSPTNTSTPLSSPSANSTAMPTTRPMLFSNTSNVAMQTTMPRMMPSNSSSTVSSGPNSLTIEGMPSSASIQDVSSSPFLPLMQCRYSYGNVSADDINNYIRAAEQSGISLMTIASCEDIANYLSSRPMQSELPASSMPAYCRDIGSRPMIPPTMISANEANADGFVWVMFPKIPLEVLIINEASSIASAIYADGSVTTDAVRIASMTDIVVNPENATLTNPDRRAPTPKPEVEDVVQMSANPYAKSSMRATAGDGVTRPSVEPVRRGSPQRYATRHEATM